MSQSICSRKISMLMYRLFIGVTRGNDGIQMDKIARIIDLCYCLYYYASSTCEGIYSYRFFLIYPCPSLYTYVYNFLFSITRNRIDNHFDGVGALALHVGRLLPGEAQYRVHQQQRATRPSPSSSSFDTHLDLFIGRHLSSTFGMGPLRS